VQLCISADTVKSSSTLAEKHAHAEDEGKLCCAITSGACFKAVLWYQALFPLKLCCAIKFCCAITSGACFRLSKFVQHVAWGLYADACSQVPSCKLYVILIVILVALLGLALMTQ
jgi:hypothetical protein